MPDPIASKITEKTPSYEDCNKHETPMLEHLWHMYTIFQHKTKRRYCRRRKDTLLYSFEVPNSHKPKKSKWQRHTPT
jgi:hypothetical protein